MNKRIMALVGAMTALVVGAAVVLWPGRPQPATAKLQMPELNVLKNGGSAPALAGGGAATTPAAAAAPADEPAAPLDIAERAAGAAPKPANDGGVADGSYACKAWLGSAYVDFGTFRSVGGTIDASPLTKAGAQFLSAKPSGDGITVSYRTKRGYAESMDCTRQ